MRNNTFLFWVLLLVDGVFGSDEVISVSVMEGDSVTLRTNLTDIQGDSKIIWNYGKDNIAKITEGNPSYPNTDERFRDGLKLDEQTGSLTIRNIRSEHAGDYSVDVKTTAKSTTLFKVTVHDHVDSVPVMQGDSVTLHTGVTDIQRDDPILWKFGDQIILTDRLNAAVDERWKNVNLNAQTGEITIRNIRNDQSGDYKMELNSIKIRVILHKKFSVTVGGVFSNEKDGVKTVSKKTGTDVLLHTRVTEIEKDDPIEWTFGPQNISIAKTDGKRKIISYNDNDVRFNNRLYLQTEKGDLTISDANSEHSGLYQIKIMNNTYTIQKRFSVTVSGSSAAVSGICGVSFGLLVWAVTLLLL